ncbi:MAG: hypothetical protein ACRYFZ_19560 [Janthinobacterium lividum]
MQLLATTLLLGTSGCFEKQVEAPAATDSDKLNGSYKLNGELVRCSVQEEAFLAKEGNQTLEVINLWFVTVPQPASGEELIALTFSKPVEQSTFTLVDIGVNHCRYPQVNGHLLQQHTSTAVATGTGGLSGTFSGTASVAYGTGAQQDFHFTDGVFIDVHR